MWVYFFHYLEVFRGARQDSASLFPDRTLIVLERPEQGLLVVGVPQQDLQVALGLARQLVGEEEAEGPRFGRHHGAHEAGPLLLRLQAGIHVEVAVELCRGVRKIKTRGYLGKCV